MTDKTLKKSMLSVVLILVLCLETIIPVAAAETNNLVYVHACTTTEDESFWLPLLNVNGTAYISGADAVKLSGMEDYRESADGIEFSVGNHSSSFSGNCEEFNQTMYYELQPLMDTLSTNYEYLAETETLVFAPYTSFYTNLIRDCKEIYADSFDIAYLDNPWGYGISALYNIIGGLRFDVVWGGYQKELYDKTVAGIMQPDETTDTLLSVLGDVDSVMSDFSTIYELNETMLGEYSELFGVPLDDFIKMHDAFNGLGSDLFSAGDFVDIAQDVCKLKNSSELYVNAVRYGLVTNKDLDNDRLQAAAEKAYSIYTGNAPSAAALLKEKASFFMNSKPNASIKDVLETAGLQTIYIDTAKLVIDQLGMDDASKATEQSHVCAEIQAAAKQQYEESRNKDGTQALSVKYSTLLYLRACSYAYSLYEFDDELRWAAEFWKEKTKPAIEKIAAYSDFELTETVKNEKLDLTEEGYCPEPEIFYKWGDQISAFEENGYKVWMTQSELNHGTSQAYQYWDELLNEVYQYLKRALPKSDFDMIQADQRTWIAEKESAIEAAGAEYAGGTIQPMIKNGTGASWTKKRIKHLLSLIADEKSLNTSFDNSYWHLSFGQTNGSQFEAQFYSDGTFLAYCFGSASFSSGTYTYADETLTIDFLHYTNISYSRDWDDFVSKKTYPMQVGYDNYTIVPSDGEQFKSLYSAYLKNQQAQEFIFDTCSDILKIAEHALGKEVEYVEKLYGEASFLYSTAGWTMLSFENSSPPFNLEFSDAADSVVNLYVPIKNLELDLPKYSEFEEACQTVFSSQFSLAVPIKTTQEQPIRISLYGLEEGKLLDDAYFLIYITI